MRTEEAEHVEGTGAHAASVGLTTPEGRAADDRAIKHGQRQERVAVTMLDVSTKLAAAKDAHPVGRMPWEPTAEELAHASAEVAAMRAEEAAEEEAERAAALAAAPKDEVQS